MHMFYAKKAHTQPHLLLQQHILTSMDDRNYLYLTLLANTKMLEETAFQFCPYKLIHSKLKAK
jgi:hypothetical protein